MYRKLPNHHCCESSYQSFANSSDPVCCHGTLVPALQEHRCCGGYYIRVQASKTPPVPVHPHTRRLIQDQLRSVSPLNPDRPCRCRRDLLPGPDPLAGVSGSWRQLLRRRSLLRQGRAALLRREPPRRLRGPVLRWPYCGRQAGVLRRLRGGGGALFRSR